MELNKEQNIVLDNFQKIKIYQIDGPAGKTELTRIIIEITNKNIIVCNQTHKACQVLKDRLRDKFVEILN